MKNMLCVLVVLGIIWAYRYSESEPPAPAPALVPAAPAVAIRPVAPKPVRLYYHSPLDAPSMSAENHTGFGYFSAEDGNYDETQSPGWTVRGAAGMRSVANSAGPRSHFNGLQGAQGL